VAAWGGCACLLLCIRRWDPPQAPTHICVASGSVVAAAAAHTHRPCFSGGPASDAVPGVVCACLWLYLPQVFGCTSIGGMRAGVGGFGAGWGGSGGAGAATWVGQPADSVGQPGVGSLQPCCCVLSWPGVCPWTANARRHVSKPMFPTCLLRALLAGRQCVCMCVVCWRCCGPVTYGWAHTPSRRFCVCVNCSAVRGACPACLEGQHWSARAV
jgi:hypothetical protein